jgi:uncharacterized membrane protein
MQNSEAQKPNEIVRYVRLESLTVYEISEDELNNLEHGSPAPLLLSVALFLLGAAITAMATLLSVAIQSTRIFCTFMIFTVIGYVVGGVLLVVSIIQIRKTKTVGNAIRNRARRCFAESQQLIEGTTEDGK